MPGSNELGEFLRARRARLRPGDVSLSPGSGARRTPGLRREEVAALAGLSIDYYIRLEQGKESNPSGPILDGLARALRLNEEEHAHLYVLANHAAGRVVRSVSRASRVVRPGIRQLLETVRPCPAHVLTRTSDLLTANPEALALYFGLGDWPASRRNTIRYTFLHLAARKLFADWEHAAETTAAHLRSLAAETPDDPDVSALIAELLEHSPDFGQHRAGEGFVGEVDMPFCLDDFLFKLSYRGSSTHSRRAAPKILPSRYLTRRRVSSGSCGTSP